MPSPTRIMIQLEQRAAGSAGLPEEVRKLLADNAGDFDSWMPHPNVLPGFYVVTVPSEVDSGSLLAQLRRLGVVKNAELDQARNAL